MKKCTRCGVEKASDCFSVRRASKDGLSAACKSCRCEADKAKYAEDVSFRDKAKQRSRDRAKTEEGKASSKKWYATHSSSHKKRVYLAQRARKDNDPAWRNADNVWRAMRALGRVPRWASKSDTMPFYDLVAILGPGWVVDHIVPINGQTVSGLHVRQNLQVVSAHTNSKKGNRFNGELEIRGVTEPKVRR